MGSINIGSVMSKVQAFTNSKDGKEKIRQKIKEYRELGVSRTEGGGFVMTVENMCIAAEDMINLLQSSAAQHGLPQSVLDHFRSLAYNPPAPVGDGKDLYAVDIFFQDDMSRMSLLITSGKKEGQRTGDGINNIVALFNNGYCAGGTVFGSWGGHESLGTVASRRKRDEGRFIEQAVMEFNVKWGKTYNVQAMIVTSDYR